MKKTLVIFSLIFVMSVSLFAEPSGKGSLLPYNDVVILGCTDLSIKSVGLSSTTATSILAAKKVRKGVAINNVSGYTIHLATYAATSTTSLYPLQNGAEFSDIISCYVGEWYGMGTNVHRSTITVVEKW